MDLYFTIPVNDKRFTYPLLRNTNFQKINHEGVIYLSIYKEHDHKYELAAFIYIKAKYIFPRYYTSKKKLYGAIQKLLQEEL